MDPAANTPMYARGCDLSRVPLAANTPPADLKAILGVDSSNPFLRKLRMQQGFLDPAKLPPDLLKIVPIMGIHELPPTKGDLK
jgi:hypothetical protein